MDGATVLGRNGEKRGTYLMVSNSDGEFEFPGKLVKEIHIPKLHSRLTESEFGHMMLKML